MREVSHSNGVLFFNVGQERALVVDLEVEDTMLIGKLEASSIDGGVRSGPGGLKGQAVEGGKHGKFQLDHIAICGHKWYPVVPGVLRESDFIRLRLLDERCVSK